jgi:hypothetical protein
VTREWRKLHNEELHNSYSSPDIIRQVKSRRMRWAGHVARMGEERKLSKVMVERQKERDRSEDQSVCGKMGLEWILGRLAWGVDWIRLAQDRDRWRAVVGAVMNLRVLAPRN